jgi:hypothetical protein
MRRGGGVYIFEKNKKPNHHGSAFVLFVLMFFATFAAVDTLISQVRDQEDYRLIHF